MSRLEYLEEQMKYGDESAVDKIDRYWEEYRAEMYKAEESSDFTREELDAHLTTENAEYMKVRNKLTALSDPYIHPDTWEMVVNYTPAQIDTLIVEVIGNAARHAMEVVKRKATTILAPERVGLFVTDLRREVGKLAALGKEFSAFTSAMTDTDSWGDIGRPSGRETWKKNRWNLSVSNAHGMWTCDFSHMVGLCNRAMINVNYVSDEDTLDQTIIGGLAEVDAGLTELMNTISKAKQLNAEADKVSLSLGTIAKDYQDALDAA